MFSTLSRSLGMSPQLFRFSKQVGAGKRFLSDVKKQARAERRAKLSPPIQNNPLITSGRLAITAAIGAATYAVYDINENRDGTLGKMYYGSDFEAMVKKVYESTFGRFDEIFEPSSDELIPTWPTAPCYGNPPPGTPAPPLLVVDLEKTLVGSTYDAQYGWRHVKRPGVDKFIKVLSNYYEIVIFSENDIGVSQDLLMAIDPNGQCHKLGASSAEMKGTVVIKRLDYMNRDLSRILLIDDSTESSQKFPRNTLLIKPFQNINDKTDSSLLDLIPLLQAFVHDEATDFRNTLDDLGTHEAEEACVEYQMRLSEKKGQEKRKRNRGLGGLIRSSNPAALEESTVRSTILSPSQIVGGQPDGAAQLEAMGLNTANAARKPSTKKKGGLLNWWDEKEKEKEENERRKQEKMNEIYQKRQQQKFEDQQKKQMEAYDD